MIITPTSHEERFVAKGSVTLKKYKDWSKCGKGEYKLFPYCKNIRFNDIYATFTHCKGYTPNNKGEEVPMYLDVGDWYLSIVTREEPAEPAELAEEQTLEDKQITFFDLIGD